MTGKLPFIPQVNTMKRTIIIPLLVAFTLIAVFVAGAYAMTADEQTDLDAMAAANQLYEAGHYAEAAQLYQQLTEQGIEDSTLFYNLGNAFYQQNQIVPAILSYQHAAQLAPRDADIQANLALALDQAPVHLTAAAFGRIGQITELTDTWLTLDELAMLALGLWSALGLLLFLWRGMQAGTLRNLVRYATVTVFVLVLLSVVSLGSRAAIGSAQQTMFSLEPQFAELIESGT